MCLYVKGKFDCRTDKFCLFCRIQFLQRLGQLKTWFDEQQGTQFIASSFLFLYDGEESVQEVKPITNAYRADIRLIDFAHVSHPATPKHDEGLQTGIATLIQCYFVRPKQLRQLFLIYK